MNFKEFLDVASKISAVKEHDSKDFGFQYLDVKNEPDIYPSEIGTQMSRTAVNRGELEIALFSKKLIMGDSLKIDEDFEVVLTKLVTKIRDLCIASQKNSYSISADTEDDNDLSPETLNKKLVAKINMAANIIATRGRFGIANYIIINSQNEEFANALLSYTTVVNDNVVNKNEYLVGRKNEFEQPGISFVYHIDGDVVNYSIVDVGFFPEKQMMYIEDLK